MSDNCFKSTYLQLNKQRIRFFITHNDVYQEYRSQYKIPRQLSLCFYVLPLGWHRI